MRKLQFLAIAVFLVGVMTVGIGYVASDTAVPDSMSQLSLTEMQNKYGGCGNCISDGPYDCHDDPPGYCFEVYMEGSCVGTVTGCIESNEDTCFGPNCRPITRQVCRDL